MNFGMSDSMKQFLSFCLDNEIYAIEIQKVKEVLDYTKIRPVPRMPKFMKGVINLRGSVVPVLDLRIKFDLHICEDTVNTCIVIVELPIEGEKTSIGIIADSVQEVITLEKGSIEPAPKIGTQLHSEYIEGMCKRNDDFIILLDLIKIFTQNEIELIASGNDMLSEGETEEKVEEVSA